ncbi:hypothetical protein COP1_003478 [Malus domestica]
MLNLRTTKGGLIGLWHICHICHLICKPSARGQTNRSHL